MKYPQEFIDFLKAGTAYGERHKLDQEIAATVHFSKEELFANWEAAQAGEESYIASDLLEMWKIYIEFAQTLKEDPEKAAMMMIELRLEPVKFLCLINLATYALNRISMEIINDEEEEQLFKDSMGD